MKMEWTTLRTWIVTPALILAAWLATGCAKGEDRQLSDYDQANEYIENGNYQSAILLMDDRTRVQPQDRKARVILASAYAAKAGIFIRSYMDLAQEIVDTNQAKDSIYDQRGRVVFEKLRNSSDSKGQKDLIDTLAEFNKALWQVSDLIVKFDKIPTITTKEQYSDVRKAVEVLSTDVTPSGGPAIYRGLLRLVLFRYHMNFYYRLPEIKNCEVDVGDLYKKISQLRKEISTVLQDFQVGVSSSKQAAQIEGFVRDVDTSFGKALDKLSKYSKGGPADMSLFLVPFGVECQ